MGEWAKRGKGEGACRRVGRLGRVFELGGLLNPYTGSDPTSMASRLARVSETYSTLTIQSLCLLVQERNDANWIIYREVSR